MISSLSAFIAFYMRCRNKIVLFQPYVYLQCFVDHHEAAWYVISVVFVCLFMSVCLFRL